MPVRAGEMVLGTSLRPTGACASSFTSDSCLNDVKGGGEDVFIVRQRVFPFPISFSLFFFCLLSSRSFLNYENDAVFLIYEIPESSQELFLNILKTEEEKKHKERKTTNIHNIATTTTTTTLIIFLINKKKNNEAYIR